GDRRGCVDQGAERRAPRRAQGGRDPRRGHRSGRARHRRQRRRSSMAGCRRGRGRPPRAARRDPLGARAQLRRVAQGPLRRRLRRRLQGTRLRRVSVCVANLEPSENQGPLTSAPALPAASLAWSDHDVTGAPVHGNANVPAGSDAETGVPLIVPATVAASVSENVSDAPATTLKARAAGSIAKGASSETVAHETGTVTTPAYRASGSRTPADVPSHPTVWNPGPSWPLKSVAITAPARCTVT